jgi:hypothetical protein
MLSQHFFTELKMKTKITTSEYSRCNNEVSTKHSLTQQTLRSSQHFSALKKQTPASTVRNYRISKSSATMRIPHEIRGKVQALIDAYRKQQLADPDTWN